MELLGESAGRHYYRLCRGQDDRGVEPEREAKSISHEVTFEHDRTPREQCHRVLLELSEGVARRLRRSALEGWVVRLKVRFPPFRTHTRQAKLDAPTSDDLVIYKTAVELFDRLCESERPVRLLGVGVAALVAAGGPVQRGLFDARGAAAKRLLAAVDEIRERFGDDAIGHGK